MDILGNDIRTCPICKKQFGVLHPEDWVYKRRRGGGPVQYFDRYNCMRIFDKRKEKKEEDKPVKEDKRRKGPDPRWLIDGVMAAIAQGDSGKQFLIDEGYRNYSVKWKDLKAWADRHDPELREKMPESLAEKKKPAEVEKVEKVPPVELNLQGGVDYQLKIDEERKPEIDPKEAMTGLSKALGDFEKHVLTREKVLRIVDQAALECQEELAEVREARSADTFESVLFQTARAQSEDYAITKLRKKIRKILGADKE